MPLEYHEPMMGYADYLQIPCCVKFSLMPRVSGIIASYYDYIKPLVIAETAVT